MAKNLKNKRSATGNHPLLPASQPGSNHEPMPRIPVYSVITWTLDRGSVIWRIWPAVLLHTAFAAVVVTLDMQKIICLEVPNVMLTVLGVVIGFVISYRASSGYDRYWTGRTCWSDVIRTSRTLGRLIWFHVPPRLSPKTPQEIQSGRLERTEQELNKVMAEKRMALDLVEGFAVSLKHHIRSELGIYYEDLYHLVRPMHTHHHTADDDNAHGGTTSALPSPRKAQRITSQTVIINAPQPSSLSPPPPTQPSSSPSSSSPRQVYADIDSDPIIPPINAYGTFDFASTSRRHYHDLSAKSSVSTLSQHRPLMPSSQPPKSDNVMDKVDGNLIPFANMIAVLKRRFASGSEQKVPFTGGRGSTQMVPDEYRPLPPDRKWQGPLHPGSYAKHRPKIAGGGENLPLEILRCLSEWVSVLDDRGTVQGPTLGPMLGAIAAFEDSLTALERILTTPLPFTVWLYLFFLPFQLVAIFGYYAIPGVAIAAFIYLGFLAAGEEIEQPFGYDDNDLDLDLFCHLIIHSDIAQLKSSPCLHAYFGPEAEQPDRTRPRSLNLTEIASMRDQEREGGGAAVFH
ncbi:hypothetical protein CVT25_003519 [Psilocybe cyanescens]|uniref:Uncharacterized protein n=1 Tax=Psilocybe cyanescens TaxID=93625 RepID=A0A409XQY8_PSICY|nr:hypothetical protein CVT25_003519 [Psilocybe cyanescens]